MPQLDTFVGEIFVLYRVHQDAEKYICLAVTTDREQPEDFIFTTSLADLISAAEKGKDRITLANITVASDTVYSQIPFRETDLNLPNVVPIAANPTIWVAFELLSLQGAEFYNGAKWVPFDTLSFGMSSNCVYYVDQSGQQQTIWSLAVIGACCTTLQVRCSTKLCCWLDRSFPKAVSHMDITLSKATFDMDLSKMPYYLSESYVLLRFHSEELKHLFNSYYLYLAELRGTELANWIAHLRNGVSMPAISHMSVETGIKTAGVKFICEPELPDFSEITRHITPETKIGKELCTAESPEQCAAILQFTDSRVNPFIASVLCGLTDGFPYRGTLTDHELLLCRDTLQKRITALASRIFAYKMFLSTCDLYVPDVMQLLAGDVHIRRGF